jgi:hypothetical protein
MPWKVRFSLLPCILGSLLATGCLNNMFRPAGDTTGGNAAFHAPSQANELISHLNKNTQTIQSVEAHKIAINVTQDGQPFGVDGMLAFQKNRNFRMVAKSISGTEADLGSNDREFWFYMKRNNPPDLFFCSYDDLPKSQVKLPIQPDWIAEALCVSDLNWNEYQIRNVPKAVELYKTVVSPTGEKLIKTVAVATTGPNAGNVVVHRLVRANGQEIWRADITEYQDKRDVGNFTVPRKVKISCPEQKVTIEMKMDGCKINQLNNDPTVLFGKPTGYKAHDLAQLQYQGQGQGATTTNGIQRVRGSNE